MSIPQITRARGPWTSVNPSTLSALKITNSTVNDFRAKSWIERPPAIFEQRRENDQAFLAWLDMYGARQTGLSQVISSWYTLRPADHYTTNTKAIAAADTYIALDDSLIAKVGFKLIFVSYGAEYRVLEVDDDNSEGWTNDAGDACNVRVERLTGPAVAISANEVCNAGHAPLGELGTPKRDTTTVPGDPSWNTISLVGVYNSISHVQDQSDMIGEWGTHPKIMADLWYNHRMAKQFEMLFSQRFSGNDTLDVEGQLYIGNGIVPQIKTNVMEAGSLGVNLSFPELNDFWELTFDSELSASEKSHFCGAAQFRDIRKAAIEGGAELEMLGIQSGIDNAQSIGANTMRVQLNSGRVVNVYELKQAFSQPNLVDWGITMDADNLVKGVFGDFDERYVDDIETRAQGMTLRSDAVVDSWMMAVIDESTFGVIRGGTRGLINR